MKVYTKKNQCFFAPLSSTDPSLRHWIDTEVKSRIRKLAMSPNDNLTAFILEEHRRGGVIKKIGLYRREDMQ